MAVEDVDYGDTTHRYGDKVALPHDQESSGDNDVNEGEAVAIDENGYIAKADVSGAGPAVGVLKNYEYFGDSPNEQIAQGTDATVLMQGTVKARVASGVSAGEHLATPDSSGTGTAGVLAAGGAGESNFVALSDATQEDLEDGTTAYYAEVLLR